MTTDDVAYPTAPSARRRTVPGVLGIAALVLLAVLTWFVVHDPRPQAASGARYEASSDLATVHTQSLELPWGRVTVKATDPRRSLPRDFVRNYLYSDPAAPDGGRFVGLSWQGDSSTDYTAADNLIRTVGPFARTHLSVIADGRTYPVEDPQAGTAPCERAACLEADSIWLAVKGSARHLLFAADYAGVTQTVDLRTGARSTGRAAPLYSATSGAAQGYQCGTARLPAGWTPDYPSADCRLFVSRLPYLPRLGWAPPGSTWIVVQTSVDPPLFVRHRRGTAPTAPTDSFTTSDAVGALTVTLPGARLHGPLPDPDAALIAAGGGTQIVVFTGGPSTRLATLSVSTTVALVPRPNGDSGGSARGPLTLPMTWTVSL